MMGKCWDLGKGELTTFAINLVKSYKNWADLWLLDELARLF